MGSWWILALVVAQLFAAEWFREPNVGYAWLSALASLVLAIMVYRRGWRGRALAGVAVVLAGLVLTAQWQLHRTTERWPEVREERISGAADAWGGDLRAGRTLVTDLVAKVALTDSLSRSAAFERVGRLVANQGGEVGVVVVDADGTPYVWGGRLRLRPEAGGDSIRFRSSPYYAVLESRRTLASGRIAVASLLLAADSTVPDRARSLASRFEERTGVGLSILPPGLAPDTSDVFDYMEPTASGLRLLFSIQLVPPSQSASIERLYRGGVSRVVVVSLVALALALSLADRGWPRFLVLALPAVVAARAPLGDALDLPALFSPAAFFHPMLGPLSHSAGPLLLASMVLVVAAVAWLGRPAFRRWWGAPIALVLLVAAPYLVSQLGRGIQVRPGGTSAGLWLTWQLTVFLLAAALILIAAALLPALGRPRRWTAIAGAGVSVVAAMVGLVIWNARFGWADWYPLLWAVGLGLVIWPGRRALTLVGVGIAVGSAAALMVWGAEIEAHVAAGRADLGALGARAEPVAEPLLEAFLDRAESGPAPRTTSELFALWRSSPLSRHGFPSALGIWTAAGELKVGLRLDEVDLPDSLVGRAVRELPDSTHRAIQPLRRTPSIHHLALVRLDAGTVLAAGIGPRTGLVPQARLGRVLQPRATGAPLYRLTLAPTGSLEQPHEGVTLWRRVGWTARGSRTVAMADGARDVAGSVELGRPVGLLVRGALLVVFDCLVLFALAALADWMATGRLARPAWWPDSRAFRTRIAVALGAFFLVPAASFALLNILELSRDGQGRRDLMIAQTLRDAAPGTTLSFAGGTDLDRALDGLAERVDANLVLYKDGLLIASNGAGVFEDFSVVDALVEPRVFQRILLENESAAVTAGPSPSIPTRIGVRAVRLPTGDPALLASPQPIGDVEIAAQQYDLAYGLALAVVLGLVAALVGAQWSARALSRPVADLREAALAFGRGEELPGPATDPPPEFQPVFAALGKMADDVRSAQEAQEHAARVLAWGEMASQVAHEIKNPLTPMRLGIQHLQRVHRDGKPLGPTLDETARRILGEIDRLDTIARAFSRFAAPADGRPAPEPTLVAAVCREVVDLYGLAPDSGIRLEVAHEGSVLAHRDEVKETVINLLENARNAAASRIVVSIDGPVLRVIDNGTGIPPERLGRIFEPRFSTTTSGSGLGLAIVKRLVEGWGATIEVASEVDHGTTVTIRFAPAPG
ncbi:MAG: sensor histidine kinase [Gemmatimonadales bacterium]